MSFDFSTLVYDRTDADVDTAAQLNALGISGMSLAQIAAYMAGLKGAYNATDLNRVGEAADALYDLITGLGYTVSGYVPLRTNWTVAEIPTQAAMETYLATIQALIDVFNGGTLPAGYTELEYIEKEAALSPYIITDYYPSSNTRVVMDYMLLADGRTTYKTLYGSVASTAATYALIPRTSNSTTASSGASQVDVGGVTYYDTTAVTEITNPNVTATDKQNIVEVTDATLVSPSNVAAVAQAVYNYYTRRSRQSTRIVVDEELPGDYVTVITPWETDLTGHITSMDLALSTIAAANCEILEG